MFALQYDEDGNWLDSPILVESVGTHEGPDYHEDQEAYLQAYASLESLAHYIDTLQQLKGINQFYAQEAYDHIEGWGDIVPKAYYTTHLSQTQYKYTQESLVKVFWEKLKALWAYMTKLVKRALELVQGQKEPIPDAQAQRFAQIIGGLEKEINYGFKMEIGGHEQVYHTLNDLLTDLMSEPSAPVAYKEIFFTRDVIWRDMVMNGPYTQLLVGQTHLVEKIHGFLERELETLLKAVDYLRSHNTDDAMKLLQALKTQDREMDLVDIKKQLTKIKMEMHVDREELQVDKSYTLYAQQARYYWRTQVVEKIFENVKATSPEVQKVVEVNEKIQSMITGVGRMYSDSEVGQLLLEVSNRVNDESSAAVYLIRSMQEYVQHHRKCMESSYAFTRYFMRKITPFMEKNANDGEISKVQQELNSIMKA